MPASTRNDKPAFRLHLRLIRLISLSIPRRLRADWKQEWVAELQHREWLLREWDKLTWKAKLGLLKHGLGALLDALWFQQRRLEDDMIQDIRFGIRMLLRSPVFTAVAVLSLALGIGANTAIFSLINAVMLERLPVQNPDQLVLLRWTSGKHFPAKSLSGNLSMREGFSTSTSFSYPAFEQLRERNDVCTDVFAFASLERLNVSIEGEAELASGMMVSGEYYAGLGVPAILGRTITVEDNSPAAGEPVAVISYAYWQRRFSRDETVLGKNIYLNGTPFTIIGVTPKGFNGTLQVGSSPEIIIPLATQPQIERDRSQLGEMNYWWVQVMGRLKPGVTRQQARGSLDATFQQTIAQARPSLEEEPDPTQLEVSSGSGGLNESRTEMSAMLWILMGVVGLVLAIACINLANLLLARAASRQREIGVRLALGASRLRLIRQLLTESLLLAALGGVLGLLLVYWSKGLLLTLLPTQSPLTLNLNPDFRTLAFTAGVAVLTGLLFGLAPALRATRVDVMTTIKDNAGTASRARSRLSKLLLVAQVALSLLLLIGAGLFVRTLRNLERVDLGFNRENVLLFRVDPTLNGYKEKRLASLYQQMLERIETVPGVRSVSLSSHPLISNSANIRSLDEKTYVYVQQVSPNFLETMEIPLAAGRNLRPQDDENAPKVMLVNQTLARLLFPDEDAVGKHYKLGGAKGTDYEIVGVARDAKHSNVRDQVPPTMYAPYAQNLKGLRQMSFEVRTAADPTAMAAAIRHAVQEVDSNIPLFNLKTQSEQVNETLAQERLFARLSSFFGVLALLLASIGLYGLMSYSVARRTHEIGIRMALGAQPGNVRWLVLREMLSMVVIGVAIGLPAAYAATKVISSMLFGLTATDPLTIATATLFLIGVSAIAGYLPARRASRVDPLVALRYE